MHKKLLTAMLISVMLMACTGCGRDAAQEAVGPDSIVNEQESTAGEKQVTKEQQNAEEDKQESTAADDKSTADGQEAATDGQQSETEDVEREQEIGAAQEAANEIDAMHEKEELPEKSVEQAAFAQKKLMLDESAGWIRIQSEDGSDGSCTESYAYDENLEYSWSYTPGALSDVESAISTVMEEREWLLTDSARNDELSGKLGLEVYSYSAYEDDNGYSMLHEGLWLNTENGYYMADFSMMEGNMGEYYDTAHALLAQIYIEK